MLRNYKKFNLFQSDSLINRITLEEKKMIIKKQRKNVSVQRENAKIPSIPFRRNISDYSGFIHQLMGTLAMQAKIGGIFFTEIAPY